MSKHMLNSVLAMMLVLVGPVIGIAKTNVHVPDSSHLAVPVSSKHPAPPMLQALDASQGVQVVQLVNQERQNAGLPPLKLNAALTNAAEGHSQAMAERNFFSHCDPDTGTSVGDRATAAGYTWNWVGENIAAGQQTPASVMNAWMDSPGHRANILSANYREMGAGLFVQSDDQDNVRLQGDGDTNCNLSQTGGPYQRYWTQVFGAFNSAYPIIINGEQTETSNANVSLYVYGSGWAEEMRLRNDSGSFGPWQPFQSTLDWSLRRQDGQRTVTVELRRGSTVKSASDSIFLTGQVGGDAELSLGVVNSTLAEGDSGNTTYTFQVSRSGDTSGTTSVDWTVTGSGANPADSADFSGGTLPGGTVTFAAGQSVREFNVAVAGDTEVESDEGFAATLSNPSNGSTIMTATATAVILNDDTPPPASYTLGSTAGLTVAESGSTASFTVVLDAQPASNVGFEIDSSDTGEVRVLTEALNFTSANWNSPQTVTVAGVDDADVDGNQSVTITVAVAAGSDSAYASLADQTVLVTNTDDDKNATVSVPSAPLQLAVTPGEGSLDVRWVAPADDGGSPISSYLAEANPTCEVAARASEVPGNTSYSCTLDNLNPGQEYDVRVFAINAAGKSAAAVTSASPLPLALPDPEWRFSERSDGVYANSETMQNEGVSVAYFDNKGTPFAFFAWYTYDELGFQRYVVAAGPIAVMELDDGTKVEVVTAEAVTTEGGTFGPSEEPSPADEILFDTYSFVPMTCNGLAMYDAAGELIELLERVGSFRSCDDMSQTISAPPPAIPTSRCYETQIEKNFERGLDSFVRLQDGTDWKVDALDEDELSTWLASDRVLACPGISGARDTSPSLLVNLDQDDQVLGVTRVP